MGLLSTFTHIGTEISLAVFTVFAIMFAILSYLIYKKTDDEWYYKILYVIGFIISGVFSVLAVSSFVML